MNRNEQTFWNSDTGRDIVTSQTDTEIIRTVTFKEGMGPPGGNGKLEERITLDGGMKVSID